MPHNYLRFRFQDDGDGTGKLVAQAESSGFAGTSGAYFNVDKIEEFAAAISAFPLPERDMRRSIAGGFGKKNHPGEMDEHLGIAVYPIDLRRGHIGVQVRMATELWDSTRPESQHTAKVEIKTTYEPLAQFSKELIRLVRGDLEEAVLVGETFGSS